MAKGNEDTVMKLVLISEGGYVNDPDDPGGATNRGVIQATYDGYRKRKGLKLQSVKKITDAEVYEIYDRQYWDAVKGDDLPYGLDYVLMDGGVNSGPTQSVKWLQRALAPYYKGSIDGQIGNQTIAAIHDHPNVKQLINAVLDRRLNFLENLKTWKKFGKGWKSRISAVRAASLKMFDRHPVEDLVIAPSVGMEKAPLEDAKTLPAKAPTDILVGGGIGAGGMAGTLQQLQDQLLPISGNVAWINHVVAGLAVAGAVLAIGGIAYRWYVTRKTARMADALDLPHAV